ncbi:MAG: hypothetical protein JXA90_14430 [Planctomycetes bacterium]|nr:hypothetical protein [Planctomycetota bacterium]
MLRFSVSLSVWLIAGAALVSCTKDEGPAGGVPGAGEKAPSGVSIPAVAEPAAGGEKAPADLPDVEGAVEAAKEKAEETVGTVKATAEDVAEDIETATEEVKEEASKAMEDLANVAESTFSLEKLKETLGSLSSENLVQVADKLMAAFKNQEGIVKGLKEQIASLGVADALQAGELKKKLESGLSILDGLKQKLSAVVASLKEKGLDVSKYTELLGGS